MRRWAAVLMICACAWAGRVTAQVQLADETDRAAFRAWFTLLADAQFERATADVTDCAALVRHAVREALRPHTPEWIRRADLPFAPQFADVKSAPRGGGAGLPLFKVAAGPTARYAEFADAKTLIRLNTRAIGRDVRALRAGDLLYFHQPGQRPSTTLGASEPDHLMVFVGRSHFDADGDDWIVYHTGPSEDGPGEVRKVRLSTLVQHPAPRWRPLTANPNFVGVFRLNFL